MTAVPREEYESGSASSIDFDSLPVDFPETERYSEVAMRSLNLHHGHHHHHHAQSVLAAVSGVAK